MRIAVLGAGIMGTTAARLLAPEDADLLVLDADEGRAKAAVAAAGRGESAPVDAGSSGLAEALRGADVVATCLPYRLNLAVMEAALEAGCAYADLGGLFHTTLRQLELHDRFRAAGLSAVVGIGIAPGVTNLFARIGADRLDTVTSIDMLNGSIDEDDSFGVPYAADTILDELTLPAMAFEGGELREVPAGSGAKAYRFPEPIGELEAVYTLHSELATLPRTIEGVRDVRWRLALPPAIARGFGLLAALGLAGTDPVETSAGPVAPREVTLAALARLPRSDGPHRDAEATVVEVRGTREGRPAVFVGEATTRPVDGLSAGAFGTALPLAVAARWLAEGRIAPGVHPPEEGITAEPFMGELAERGMSVRLDLKTA